MRASILASFVVIAACSSSSTAPGPTATDTGTSNADTTPPDDTGSATDAPVDDTTPTDGTTADTWTSFAHDFVVKYCTECHNTSDHTTGDFSVQSNVTKESKNIRCGVAPVLESGCSASPFAPKQFPICDSTCANPKPTDAERARIVAWIDAGMP